MPHLHPIGNDGEHDERESALPHRGMRVQPMGRAGRPPQMMIEPEDAVAAACLGSDMAEPAADTRVTSGYLQSGIPSGPGTVVPTPSGGPGLKTLSFASDCHPHNMRLLLL